MRHAMKASTTITPKNMVIKTAISQLQLSELSSLKSRTTNASKASGAASSSETDAVCVRVGGGVSVNVAVSVVSAESVSERVSTCERLASSVLDGVRRSVADTVERLCVAVSVPLGCTVIAERDTLMEGACDADGDSVPVGDSECDGDIVLVTVGLVVRE